MQVSYIAQSGFWIINVIRIQVVFHVVQFSALR